MTRLLFLPTPNTLLWLDVPAPPEAVLAAIERGEWIPPAPFEHIPIASLQAVCQGDVVTVTALPFDAQSAPRLGERQQQVLGLLVEGLTTRQIAHTLDCSTRTVAYHVAELKKRFGAASRAELIRKSAGFTPPPSTPDTTPAAPPRRPTHTSR